VLKSDLVLRLPTSEELPDSDDTPVDNELQNIIPGITSSARAAQERTVVGIFAIAKHQPR